MNTTKILWLSLFCFVAVSCNNQIKPSKADVQKIVSGCVSSLETKKEMYASEYLYYSLTSLSIDEIKEESNTPGIFFVSFSAELTATKDTRTFESYKNLGVKDKIISNENRLKTGDNLTVKGSLYLQNKNNNWVYTDLSLKK